MRRGWVFLAIVLGCSHAAPDATPDGAVRLWLEKMELSTEDPRVMREAHALLGPSARANLEERAQRASRVQGRRVAAHEMLAEGRFGLKFRPKSMSASTSGDQATVNVIGSDPADRATVLCVREPSGWRVEPELPSVLVLPKRSEAR